MKVAHILPPEVVGQVRHKIGGYHLLLPSMTRSNAYRDFYRGAQGYKIMDNGAAEGHIVDLRHLLFAAKAFGVNEVVLPDTLKDMDRTIDNVAGAFYAAFENRQRYRYMLVAQGKTVLECISCVERALMMMPGIINTIGIPRHILDKGMDARYKIASQIRNMSPGRQIHLLGTHPSLSNELFELGREYKRMGIRGIDTSLAWNAARQGIQLNGSDMQGVTRQKPGEFMKATLGDVKQFDLLIRNMEALDRWVK